MFNKLLKLSASLLIALFVTAGGVMASGKMEVDLGEKVVLQAEQIAGGGSYKWVATKGKEIVSTQTGSIFNYTFDRQGEYLVNLTITEQSGATKDTAVTVLVGNRFSRVTPSGEVVSGSLGSAPTVRIDTLPAIASDRSVHILGDEGRVVFDIATREDIIEYRIDRNIFVDSDGNGVANDDIDNSDHSSYLLGGVWQTKYLASESNMIVAEITVVTSSGAKGKSQVEIIFDDLPAKEGNVVAVLDSLPAVDSESRRVTLYGDQQLVAFYSKRSQGDIIEYRIDKNIFVDSSGDGDPANDIDNRTDPSFRSGDVWTTVYEDSGQQIIAQLIVVGRGGTGSRIQREIVFSDQPRPVIEVPEPSETEGGIRLTADKELVQKGDPVVFSVEGLVQDLENYIFEWDFDGDGDVDQTVEGNNEVTYIYDEAAIYPVSVKVADLDGNEASFALDMLVKDVIETTADFEFSQDGPTVTFTNLSQAAENLTSDILQYTWSFGDPDPENYESQVDQTGRQNPSYTYSAPGTYIVSLTVVDTDQVTDTFTEEVTIDESAFAQPAEEGEVAETGEEGGGSLIGTIFKWILYIVLVVVLLVVLIVVGLMVFLKLQHPDLVFEELIDELKIKLLGMLGVHEMIEPSGEVGDKPPAASTTEAPGEKTEEKAASASEISPAKPQEEAPAPEPEEKPDLAKADAPVPDWMKQAGAPPEPAETKSDVIEGEVEEPAPEPPKPEDQAIEGAEPSEVPEDDKSDDGPKAGGGGDLGEPKGPVPDWLKNA